MEPMKPKPKAPTLSQIAAVMSHISRKGRGACKARTPEQLRNAVKARWPDGAKKQKKNKENER